MFNFFKKKNKPVENKKNNFEVELTASILAYEIARSDGDISESELTLLYDEIKKISSKVGKKEERIMEIIIKKKTKENLEFSYKKGVKHLIYKKRWFVFLFNRIKLVLILFLVCIVNKYII